MLKAESPLAFYRRLGISAVYIYDVYIVIPAKKGQRDRFSRKNYDAEHSPNGAKIYQICNQLP